MPLACVCLSLTRTALKIPPGVRWRVATCSEGCRQSSPMTHLYLFGGDGCFRLLLELVLLLHWGRPTGLRGADDGSRAVGRLRLSWKYSRWSDTVTTKVRGQTCFWAQRNREKGYFHWLVLKTVSQIVHTTSTLLKHYTQRQKRVLQLDTEHMQSRTHTVTHMVRHSHGHTHGHTHTQSHTQTQVTHNER